MYWVLLHVIPGRSTVKRILHGAVKMDELQAVDPIYICHCAAFSVGLDSQRHEILDVQCYPDTRATIDILWKVSLLFRSPHHPWSAKMQAVHMASRPGQCSVNLMPVVDIEHWETSGIVSTLICWYCQVLQYHVHLYFWSPFWQMAMITIQNNPESNMHGIMLRLGWISHPCKLSWGSDRFMSLVITCISIKKTQ